MLTSSHATRRCSFSRPLLKIPRERIVVACVTALALLSTGTSMARAQSGPGLMAGYAFNEGAGATVLDTSGNGNTGAISGATWTAAGKYGGALQFNGTNAVVTVPSAASLQLTTGMTLEAWVYPTVAPTGWKAIVDKNVDGYYLMASSTPNNRPAAGGTWTAGNQNTAGPAALAVNTWTHLAATFDGATVRLYVNGVQVASRGQTTTLMPTTGTLQIGGDAYPGEYFTGRIDEVRVYNRALSAGEIQVDMNTPVGGTPPPNTPPTITSLGPQTANEDTPTGILPFTVGDAETAAGSLTVSGNSSNATLVPTGNIVFGGTGANRTVRVTPAANQSGTATITVMVSDGQLSTSTNFLVTVAAVNDAPTITGIVNQTTTVGTAVGPLAFTVGDVETAAGSLAVSGSSSNSTLVPTGNIVFGGTGANRTVTVTPASGQTGTATISVAVSDGQASMNSVFQVTVTATNTPPTIGNIAPQAISEDTATGALPFTVGDVETAAGSLTVSGSSSDATLVPTGNIVFAGAGANRTVRVTPAVNQSGMATITVTVSDGQLSASTTFLLSVAAVNDAPTITGIANQTTTVGTAVGPLAFTVSDAETAAGSLTVSGISSNEALVPTANIVFGGTGANRTVTVVPAPAQAGTATITVSVSDGQASANTAFQLTVSAQPLGLMAGYAFNEGAGATALDTSGNGNTGAISGATWTAAGKYGGALQFNGTNAVVTVPSAASLQLTTGMTLEAWVYPTVAPTGWKAIVGKNVDGYYLMASSTPNNRPAAGGTWTAGNQNTAGPAALAVNTWTHLAATFDGATVRLYVNGVQVASQGQTTTLMPTTGTLQIGGDAYPGEYFTGRIDEVRVYNRALSAGEIQVDMNTAVGGPPASDPTPPTVAITAPASGATVAGAVTVTASAADNLGVVGVQFLVDGAPVGAEDTTAPYGVTWDTGSVGNGPHTLSARARDAAGNSTLAVDVSVTVANTPATGGLMAGYAFNEGAGAAVLDMSGNGNTGTISGATWTAAGKYGGALQFNGTNAVVTVPNAASLRLTTGMTLEAWVYPTVAPTGWKAIVDKNVDGYYLMASSTPNNRPAAGGTWTAGNQNTAGPAALAVNTWTHLAATFDGATVRLYVNGVQVASQGQTTALGPATGTLQIGGDAYPGEYFTGRIDEVRVYNRALSAGEIQVDMNTAVGGGPTPDTTPPR